MREGGWAARQACKWEGRYEGEQEENIVYTSYCHTLHARMEGINHGFTSSTQD